MMRAVSSTRCPKVPPQETWGSSSIASSGSGVTTATRKSARVVAKQYNVKYEAAQLTKPVYNIQLGEAFLGDLIHSYSGSYLLALAAYNAGGGPVQEWTKQFGDPRNPDVDPIDWIERLRFTETGNCVWRTVCSLLSYRPRYPHPQALGGQPADR